MLPFPSIQSSMALFLIALSVHASFPLLLYVPLFQHILLVSPLSPWSSGECDGMFCPAHSPAGDLQKKQITADQLHVRVKMSHVAEPGQQSLFV